MFREKLPEWQEAFMERLIKEYAELLNSDKAATEKFWALDKRIRADRKSIGVRANEESGSKLKNILTELIIEYVISVDDLQDFSAELRESTSHWIHTYCSNLE